MLKKFLITIAFLIFSLESNATNFDENGNFYFVDTILNWNNKQMCFEKSEHKRYVSPEVAFNYYKKNAENGHKECLYNLGVCYHKGIGVEKNFVEAFKYFELAAVKKYAPAQYVLGNMYRRGLGGSEPSDEKAIHYYKLASDQEYPPALNNLAYMYEYGRGVKQDYKKAFIYLKQAADLKDAMSQFALGQFYRKGLGMEEPDLEEAIIYYKLAAKQNHKEACVWVACMYAEGRRVEQNYRKALKYFTTAADLGDVTALYNLGVMCENGQGMEGRDYKKAYACYLEAANQGHKEAQISLAELYIKRLLNNLGIHDLDKTCFQYVKMLADEGDIEARFHMGNFYAKGECIKQNFEKAFHYYKLAADQGHILAQFNLGVMFETARGTEKNDKEAFKYYKMSADQGNAQAQVITGTTYYNGKSIKKNDKKAFKYYKLAESNKDLNDITLIIALQVALGDMYRLGEGTLQNYKNALIYYQTAAKNGSGKAMSKIGYMHENGLGVEKNTETAKLWYIKAEHTKNLKTQGTLSHFVGSFQGGTPIGY